MNRFSSTALAAIVSLGLCFPVAPGQERQGSSAKAKKSAKVQGTVVYKVAEWPNEFRVGDCAQKPGTLTIGSDGTLHWEAVTWTYETHSGDIWHASFELLDKDGVTLGRSGNHDSPRMNDGHPPPKYRWTADDHYDPSTFAAIDTVREWAAC